MPAIHNLIPLKNTKIHINLPERDRKALENAQRKRDLLAAEINSLAQKADDLKRELAKVEAWIAQWHQFPDVRHADVPPKQGAPQNERFPILKGVELSKIRRATGNPKKEEVAEATRQIILERGEPISRGDLFKALADRGVFIASETDPEMVLSTMCTRRSNNPSVKRPDIPVAPEQKSGSR